MARKVNPNSKRNVLQKEIEQRYGTAVNDKKDWTNEEIDKLLDLFLMQQASYVSNNRDCYLTTLGRTWQSVQSMLWKLFIRYDRPSVRNYVKGKRVNREGKPFTEVDRIVIAHATSKQGIKNQAYDPDYLAEILSRSHLSIRFELHRAVKIAGGFFPPRNDIEVAQAVHTALKSSLIQYQRTAK